MKAEAVHLKSEFSKNYAECGNVQNSPNSIVAKVCLAMHNVENGAHAVAGSAGEDSVESRGQGANRATKNVEMYDPAVENGVREVFGNSTYVSTK